MHPHLTQVKRCQIQGFLSSGWTQKQIAQELGVSTSTICRELKRNGCRWGYDAVVADAEAQARRRQASRTLKVLTPALKCLIEEKIRACWSPEQISGRLKCGETPIQVSTATIYRYVHADRCRRDRLTPYLRHGGKKYRSRQGKTAGAGLIQHREDITTRPPIVEEKSRVGDFEGDTIIGASHQGVLLTLVDRASRYTLIGKLNGKYADQVPGAVQQCLARMEGITPQTITFDNGKEFAAHTQITHLTGARCYFARPYCSWQRGLNEHHNGLIRQYFPKGMKLDALTELEIQAVEDALNHRPRKVLGYKTPNEVLQEYARNHEIAFQM